MKSLDTLEANGLSLLQFMVTENGAMLGDDML